jgi:hypothetical protein
MGYEGIHAVCLTKAAQTYHHWRVFTQGASGACIYFREDALKQWLHEMPDVVGRYVEYKTVAQLRKEGSTLSALPFLKRKAYEQEEEFRILHCSKAQAQRSWAMPIEIGLIQKIVLNPWMPVSTVSSLKKVVRGIEGCKNLHVLRATIVQSDEWQALAERAEA